VGKGGIIEERCLEIKGMFSKSHFVERYLRRLRDVKGCMLRVAEGMRGWESIIQ
jgi:hypothetical protein